ncbi:MAG: ABC transporter substrate-binding protein [Cyanobacteria bacterium REEB67]|nr:ABC transporter substrate-binding protein [Cyanobacteria bacterium REEB67]
MELQRKSGHMSSALALCLTLGLQATVVAAPLARSATSETSSVGQPGWSTVQQIVQTFKTAARSGHDPARHQAAQFAALARFIDYKQIASRTLTASEWQSLNGEQRRELAATIRTLVENRYYPRWQKIFGSGHVAFLRETKSKGDLLVATNLHLGLKDDPLNWQLSSDGTRPRLISLSINKKDLLGTLRSRVEAHQCKGGYPAMIAWLKGKSKSGISGGEVDGTASGALASGDDVADDRAIPLKGIPAAILRAATKSGGLID